MKNYDKVLELLKRSLEMKEKAGAEKASILANFGLIAETHSNVGMYMMMKECSAASRDPPFPLSPQPYRTAGQRETT